jgi:hypothetical protein
MTDLFDHNSRLCSLLIEQNRFFREFPPAEKLVPHRNLLLCYRPLGDSSGSNLLSPGKGSQTTWKS